MRLEYRKILIRLTSRISYVPTQRTVQYSKVFEQVAFAQQRRRRHQLAPEAPFRSCMLPRFSPHNHFVGTSFRNMKISLAQKR